MLVVPKVSQRLWLTMVLDFITGSDDGPNPLLELHLYSNDIAPSLDSVLADFTEATFPGYSTKFVGGDFPFPTTNTDGNAQSNSKTYEFTPANQESNELVHGWYLTFRTDTVPNLLFAAERIVPAFKANAAGQSLSLQIQLTLGSRFSG